MHLPGPFNGPILQIEMARARCSSSTRSATMPGAVEIITLPKNAPINRTTIKVVTDFARAQGMIKTVKMAKQITQTGFRPYTSLNGAMNMDPMARPIRYMVSPRVTIVLDAPNSAAI